jgi:hypothetical protein
VKLVCLVGSTMLGGGGGGGVLDFGCAMAFTKRYGLTWPKVFDMFHP